MTKRKRVRKGRFLMGVDIDNYIFRRMFLFSVAFPKLENSPSKSYFVLTIILWRIYAFFLIDDGVEKEIT